MSKRKNAKHPRHGDRHNAHRRPSGVRRAVEWRDGKRIEVVSRHKGYDVGMIRDFLDQLLLELRVQYYENLQVLKRLDSTDSLTEAANTPAVPTLVNQLQTYFGKYWSSLISVTAINEEGAPAEQVPEVIRALARAKSQTRDEQIGHLEALRDLFSEALHCARLPFGITRDGRFGQPTETMRVVDFLEPMETLYPEGE